MISPRKLTKWSNFSAFVIVRSHLGMVEIARDRRSRNTQVLRLTRRYASGSIGRARIVGSGSTVSAETAQKPHLCERRSECDAWMQLFVGNDDLAVLDFDVADVCG